METENILDRHGNADHTHIENNIDSDGDYSDDENFIEEITRSRRWKAAITRCGFWTLALAFSAPVSLHCIEIFYLRSPQSAASKPSWFPEMYMDGSTVLLSLIISLSFWFGWADGGVIRSPKRAAVVSILYLILTLARDRIVFEHGAKKIGIAIAFARCLLGEQLSNIVRELNWTASKIVMDSVLLSVLVTTSMSLRLIFW